MPSVKQKKIDVRQLVLTSVVSVRMEEVQVAGDRQLTGVTRIQPRHPRETSQFAQGLGSRIMGVAVYFLWEVCLSHPSLLWLGWTRVNSVHASPARSTQEMNPAI